MLDGFYQSVMCFFITYLLFSSAENVTISGQNVDDQKRMGVYVACATIVVINMYVLMNSYRWDWLVCLIVGISILLIWFWTGVYTSFTSSATFYKAASEVFAQPTFWAITCLTVIVCLLPRFTIKFLQKNYFPLDVDIVREQVRMGLYSHLDDDNLEPPSSTDSTASSDLSDPKKGLKGKKHRKGSYARDDDRRPIYPPSVAPTANTNNNASQRGSDGTQYTHHTHQPSFSEGPVRPSFDRIRASMDRVRPSFEQSNSFTSAALLQRMESSNSQTYGVRTDSRQPFQ
jgi:phospholipid-translocating ATPase